MPLKRVFRRPLLVRRAVTHLRLLGYGLGELKRKYPDATRHRLKYLKLDTFIHRNLYICREVGLIGSPRKRALDIGCGSGLLLFCMGQLGHSAIGIDIEDDFYRDYAVKLGVDRHIEAIQPYVPLKVQGQFDLVTAIAVCFDCYYDAKGSITGYWGADEWRYFLSDVLSRLTTDGRLYLLLNYADHYPDVVAAFDPALQRDGRHRYLFERDDIKRAIDLLGRDRQIARVQAV